MGDNKFKTYLEYSERLQKCIETDSKDIIFNDSIVHAVMVMTAMLMLANQKKTVVKMFCGKFSLFRDKTEEKLRGALSEAEPEDTELKLQWMDYYQKLFGELHKALEVFLKNGGKLHLVVEKTISGLSNERIWNIIKGPLYSGQMTVAYYNNTIGIDHFAITGNAYRRENSDSEKTALCCFNSEKTSSVMNSTFELICADAQPIKIA
jgi:hypothetical protein